MIKEITDKIEFLIPDKYKEDNSEFWEEMKKPGNTIFGYFDKDDNYHEIKDEEFVKELQRDFNNNLPS